MAEWKLSRQNFGTEQFTFSEGDEVTIGRGLNNTVTLSSIVISRNHCVISFKHDEVIITDLKSSNGIYVGLKRIPPNIPFNLQDSDVIGFGWTLNAPLVNIKDNEKYVFKLTKVHCPLPLSKRLLFQNQHDFDDIEAAIATLNDNDIDAKNIKINNSKRKLSISNIKQENFIENEKQKKNVNDVISISDSDVEQFSNNETENKKIKLDLSHEKQIKEDHLKSENDDLQFEAFNVKQEYLGYDEDIQQVDSDSDSESEYWFLKLSQSSPGKPFTKIVPNKVNESKQVDNSYSLSEDFVILDTEEKNNESEQEFSDDCITIPYLPPKQQIIEPHEIVKETCIDKAVDKYTLVHTKEKDNDVNSITSGLRMEKNLEFTEDRVDGDNLNFNDFVHSTSRTSFPISKLNAKRIQMIEPLIQPSKKQIVLHDNKTISKPRKKRITSTINKKEVNRSRKEERKRKLKQIASKEKGECEYETASSGNNFTKPVVVAKITTTNRGAFLTDMFKPNNKSLKMTNLNKANDADSSKINKHKSNSNTANESIKKESKISLPKKQDQSKSKSKHIANNLSQVTDKCFKSFESEPRTPIKSVKPLKESDESVSGKPFSKVEPLCEKATSPVKKTVKKVRFSDQKPNIHIFEIEPGNKMKKISSIRAGLLDVRHMPVFSLEKITLMKILCWNPYWLDEQINNNDPPPILGHNNPPLAIFHSFTNHKQYIQLVGDLLLMEIWECLTQGYMRLPKQVRGMQMRIDSLPPIPPQERFYDLFNVNVNFSVPTTDMKSVPRVGDVLLATFGSEKSKYSRFLFVHNVRCLPSPSNNIHSFFTISLYATFTEKMQSLRPGEVMYVRNLAYINKELMLFEAMEHLAGSPLGEAILKPHPQHFVRSKDLNFEHNLKTQWTVTLNSSQKLAVCTSVTAALGDTPSIQMVQGPPGTGKSSVICAIVMTYFYDAAEKKQQNRGKILICATSNAAVDELVIRLLKIRQSLPKAERFRMVRVGRAEAMHPRARDVSSQQLAQRDTAPQQLAQRDRARLNAEPSQPGLAEEISHLEAKINMWKTRAHDARDPVRVAYCQSRIDNLVKRISLLRSGGGIGGGDGVPPEQMAQAERRIIEGADIIVTTLASAQNHKMKGLKRRIALCIIDEAGQAIEPETLIPLTLDVTRVTLIGDPQQLPGFICSQRAKKHGLGESLFSRLTSTTETWEGDSPVVLLNQQYRMHPDIADYPNRAFYGGMIQTMSTPRFEINIPPYCIICIASGDKGQGSSGANEMEAWGVARLAVALSAMLKSRNLSLAVITPYSAHRDIIKRNLRMLQDPSENLVEVNTVDSFQGQERDVVVVSLARSHGVGFLTDTGRMNVMLTRAKHALLVCLNPLAVMKNNQWRTLVEDAHKRKVYRILPKEVCQSAASSPIPHDEVLKHIQHKSHS